MESIPALDLTSVAEIVLARTERRPEAIAVEDAERRLTYGELESASAGIAAELRARGVAEEEVVGVCLERSWRAVAAFLGVVRAGAAYLPIGAAYPAQRKRDLLELAGARLVLTDADREFELPADATLLDVAELSSRPGERAVRGGGEGLAYLVFTSGSTGVPKGVEITHANLVHLLGIGSDLLPQPGDAVLSVAALEFDIAALEIWGALAGGSRLVLAPPGRPDPRRIGRLIAEREVSFAFFPAGLFEQVVRSSLPDLGGMRLLAAGGDVMAPAAAAALRTAHPQVRVINGYGPTETSIVATGFEVDEVDGRPLPIGTALPGYELYVLDEEMRPVPQGEAGELWIGGPGVARGYRGDPEGTRDRFRPDPFADRPDARMYGSGDVVRWRADGNLEFLGRADHQVKISGYRVEPGEVEQVLGAHPAVAQAAVIAREDVSGHKRLLGYAALRRGERVTERELTDHLAARLPAFMVPSTLQLLPELPLTDRGKIDRRALPDPAASPAGPLPAGKAGEVAVLMAELLQRGEIGPDDDFFALGADSLLALQLLGRVRDRFDSGLDINSVFEAPTPRRLAALLEGEARNERPLLRPGEPTSEPAPATFAQRRAWLFERMNPDSLSFQFAALLHLRGDLDEGALRGAIGDLMQRHEVFRTSLQERDGEPVQIVHDDLPVPLEVIDGPPDSGPEWARLVRSLARRRIRLDRGPLFHWTLVRRGPGRWSLIDVEHHAAHDGWSFMIVLSELAELYSARVEGRAPKLAEVEVGFGDFARWERSLASGDLERRQLDFWRRTLNPQPPLIEMPSGRSRPARESFAGGSIRRRMPPRLSEEVKEVARSEGATAFMAGLAAFAALLGRSGGVEDLQIGTGLANRRDPAAEGLVGMTVGTVALRVDLSGDPTVRELLRRVRGTVLDAIANADVPFERVVEAVGPERDPSRSPLVQTMFSFDDAPGAEPRWSGVDVEVVQTIPNGTAKADVNVIGVDHGDGNPFYIWEHSDLISNADADRLAGQHLNLLAAFAARPDARLSELQLADDGEGEQVAAWSRNEDGFDRSASVPDLVERQARRDSEAVAVLDGERRLSYGELTDRARRIAGSLRARGVQRGDAVAVLLPRSAAAAAAYLGVLDAGAAYVPLDPAHPAERIRRAIEDAGAGVVLSRLGMETSLLPGIEAIDVDVALGGEPLEPCADPEDLAYVMYTSGSTGRPKGVEVTHRNVARLVDDPGFAELGPGTTMLHAASPAFDATTLELWGPLANGGTVAVLDEQPSPDAVAAAVERHGVTTLWLTAGLFHELVDRRPDCLGRVRQVLAGGDVLSPDHVSRALRALPPDGRLSNGYGPTETTTFALTHDLRPGDEVGTSVPLGRPIQATVCEVIDAAGQVAPIGVPGELWIGGDGVARGYRGDPELTAERFRDGRYRTGDRVRRLPDGTLEFLGRLDRQLKIRGFRVEPAEIEVALREHPAVADAVVVPYERAEGDRALAAYVVTGGDPLDATELRLHAAGRLPAAMVPSAWIELESLPLTANGKVDRDRLPAPEDRHLAREAGGTTARNEAERRTIEVFERVLGVEDVGPEEDFFALGGHSLLAVGLFSQLEEAFGRRLPLATIFEASTPRALAALLAGSAPGRRWSNLVPIKPSGTRPPLFAVTAGDGNVVGFAPLADHMAPEQPFYALQPSGLDGQAAIDRGIEAMAASCIEEIRSVQAHGPYLLAGRCNGATVAFEIARQLRAAGEEVPLLVSLDSDPPNAGPLELEPGLRADPLVEAAWLRARDGGEEVPDRDGPEGPRLLADWLRDEVAPGISRYGLEIWHWREDLPARWPDPLGGDAGAFRRWLWESGVPEQGLEARLLPPLPVDECRLPNGHAWDWALEHAWRELGGEPKGPLTRRGWAELRPRLLEPLAGGRANRYLLAAARRPDLARHFPDPLGDDLVGLLSWAWVEGVGQGLAPELLPPPPGPLPRRLRLELALRPLRRVAERAGRLRTPEVRERLGLERDRLAAAAERRLGRRLPRAGRRIEDLIVAAAREARDTYRAEPWPGKIVLVTSPEFADKAAYIAWPERAAGGLERHVLPVGHIAMLREPGAAVLARCIEERIAEALGS
ncbi:MAG TPA: amino acid adenylation domain-containing protein [Solirubrobacterales bacterium]|nr:amino acid adenylation domain-containing protein [Solirubrobacterales bacterium]